LKEKKDPIEIFEKNRSIRQSIASDIVNEIKESDNQTIEDRKTFETPVLIQQENINQISNCNDLPFQPKRIRKIKKYKVQKFKGILKISRKF
jgi:hypothetical protein